MTSAVKYASGLIDFTCFLQSFQNGCLTQKATSSLQPSIPSSRFLSSLGSIHLFVMSKIYFFGPSTIPFSSSLSSGSSFTPNQPSYSNFFPVLGSFQDFIVNQSLYFEFC